MAVQLNHTIMNIRDKREAATFLAKIPGLDQPTPQGPFLVVQVDNGGSLNYADNSGSAHPQHHAVLVSEPDFDQTFRRIRDRGLPYRADSFKKRPGEVNTDHGSRGVHWEDPNGHLLKIITRPTAAEADLAAQGK